MAGTTRKLITLLWKLMSRWNRQKELIGKFILGGRNRTSKNAISTIKSIIILNGKNEKKYFFWYLFFEKIQNNSLDFENLWPGKVYNIYLDFSFDQLHMYASVGRRISELYESGRGVDVHFLVGHEKGQKKV